MRRSDDRIRTTHVGSLLAQALTPLRAAQLAQASPGEASGRRRGGVLRHVPAEARAPPGTRRPAS